MLKYPRTPHLEGSRLQAGDEDLAAVPFASIAGRRLVVEEKVDGANAAFGFRGGEPILQSRGHELVGGDRERHFDLFKRWVSVHRRDLQQRFGERYLVFGEWCYARHTIFYDHLPHYFLEFDVWDRQRQLFLDTPCRRALLDGSVIESVPVLADTVFTDRQQLEALVGPSRLKSTTWREHLQTALSQGESGRWGRPELGLVQTDPSDLAEGLYLKIEADGRVLERCKWVRAGFLQTVVASGSHWLDRPIVRNRLAPGVELFQ